ncbi:MAG: methyltransferase domain-containing protein, partial [Chloroflexota bacterium]
MRNLRVLDVAPLPVLQAKYVKLPNLDYLSVDIASPIAMVRMDITAIGCPRDQFDCILCYHVLEHVPDDRKALQELFRVLKPGGWAILQSPIDATRPKTFEDFSVTSPEERERVFGQSDHVRIYGLDYKDRLTSAGFIVRVDDYAKQLSDTFV